MESQSGRDLSKLTPRHLVLLALSFYELQGPDAASLPVVSRALTLIRNDRVPTEDQSAYRWIG